MKQRFYWTEDKQEELKKLWNEQSLYKLASYFHTTEETIREKANELGLPEYKSNRWTKEEEEKQLTVLSQNYDILEICDIMNKPYESILCKLYGMGLKAKNKSNRPWTDEESEILLELLTTYSSFEVAQMLDRSEEAVMVRAIKLGYEIDYKNRKWTQEEETILSDLWGTEPVEKIAKRLNRTVSAITNRSFVLGLGSQISNNYEGLRIQEIADIFLVNRNTILTSWVALGLKLDFRKRSNNSIYAFVQISNLYEFLEKNQNIWDSRLLEKNLLGQEPEWLQQKRKLDQNAPLEQFGLDSLTKQQLLQARKYFLETQPQDETYTGDNEIGGTSTQFVKDRKTPNNS